MRISEEINCSTTEHYLSLDKNEMGIVLHARFSILSDRTNLGAMPKSRLLRRLVCRPLLLSAHAISLSILYERKRANVAYLDVCYTGIG